MRVTKKLAAIGAAMIMAISTFSFTASANENGGNSLDMLNNTNSNENANIRVSGTTSLSGSYGNAFGTATNKSSLTRPCRIVTKIYNDAKAVVASTESSKSLSSGSSFSTDTITAAQSQCYYAEVTAYLLTDTGLIYDQIHVIVFFPGKG